MIHYLFSLQPVWFFLFALLATFLLRRWSPQICYFLWIFVLIKLLLPFGVLDRYVRLHDYVKAEKLSFFSQTVSDPSQGSPAGSASELDREEQNNITNTEADGVPRSALAASVFRYYNQFIRRLQSLVNKPPIIIIILAWVFLFVWVGTSIVLAVTRTLSHFRFKKMLESWPEIKTGFMYEQFVYCVQLVGLKFTPKLRIIPDNEDDNLRVPFTLGIRKKSTAVLIPLSMTRTTDETNLQIMFCHELVHVKKKDWIVNLLRFVCMVLFHYHPLRLLAERFVSGFQEITTDLKTIELLKISKKDYIRLLLSKFVEINQDILLTDELSTPLLNDEASFVKRLFFIKRHKPVHSDVPKYFSYFLFGIFSFFFFINLSLYAVVPDKKEMTLAEGRAKYAFPAPQKTYPSILHHQSGWPVVHNGLLWVIETRYGLSAYRMDEEKGLQLVSFYEVEKGGYTDANGQYIYIDVTACAFYGKYIYLAVTKLPLDSGVQGRVDILEIKDDGSCQKVGEIANPRPWSLLVKNQRLWMGGMGTSTNEALLSIFDLSSPAAPQEIDCEYYDLFTPSVLATLNDTNEIIAVVGSDIYFFEGDSTINPIDTLSLPGSLGYIVPIDNNHLYVFAFEGNPFKKLSLLLYSLERCDDDRFSIIETIQLSKDVDDGQFPSINCPAAINQCLFAPFNNYLTCVFGGMDGRLNLLFCSSKQYSQPVLYNDRLFCLYPETAVFDPHDFQIYPSAVFSWKKQ